METTRIMLVSFVTNLFLVIFKMLFGIIGSSGALIADGFHSISDSMVDLFALIGIKLSNKSPDKKHPYGYGKLEYLISLVMGVIILMLGFTIVKDSINKEIVTPNMFVIVISLITIMIKRSLSNYVILNGKKYKNNILISSGNESKSDVISSIVVMISVILMNLSKKIEVFKYADIIGSILVGLIIISIGFSIIKDNIGLLLDEQENDEDIKNKIENVFLSHESVYGVDNLTILKYGPFNKLIVNIYVDYRLTLSEVEKIKNLVRKDLLAVDKIKYIIIDVIPYNDNEKVHIEKNKKK